MDKKWWTLLAVCTGTFMLLLDVTIVIVAQPAIQSGLHASFSDVQWVLDAYALTLASLLLTSGVLADRYGRKRLFTIGLIIFTLGSLLCGLARDPLMLILSRSGQGVGGAIMFATSLALLGHSFRGKDRGVAFGVWGAITGVSTALGPVLGGVITTNWSWRGIFLVNVPIGVLAVMLTAWRVEESKSPRPTPPDWAGFALLTTGLVSLVYGLIRAGENSWSDTGVILFLAVGAGALAAFIVAERRVAYPMFDLSLLRTPTFAGASIAAFAMNGSLYAVLLWLVLYLQDILGYSAQDAGLRLAIISGAQFVTATIAGRFSEHVPARWLIGPGLMLVGVGLIIMAGLTGGSDWTHLIPGFIVSGLGAGLVNPPLASTAIGVVPPQKAGMASGVNATFRQIGIAAGIAGLGAIFNSALQHNLTSAAAVASSAPRIVTMVRQGQVGQLLASLPPRPPGRGRGGHQGRVRGRRERPPVRDRRHRAGRRGVGAAADPQQGLREPRRSAGRAGRGRGGGRGQCRPGPFGIKKGTSAEAVPGGPGCVSCGALGLCAQRLDGAGRVFGAVHGRAGHEHVGPGLRAPFDGLLADSPVDLEPHGGAVLGDQRARAAELGQHHVQEVLTAEARFHRHQQEHVDLGQQVLAGLHGRAGVHGEPGARARGADGAQRPHRGLRRLDVDRHVARAGLGVARCPPVGLLDHQVTVEGQRGVLEERLDHGQAQGEVRHEVVVHHIHVQPVRDGGDRSGLIGEAGKIR